MNSQNNAFCWREQPSTIGATLMRGLASTQTIGKPPPLLTDSLGSCAKLAQHIVRPKRNATSSIATPQAAKAKPTTGAFGSV